MLDDIIKKLKISIKGEGKIIVLLKNIVKTENLKNIRNNIDKITSEYQFCDGEDVIEFYLEADYEIGDLVDSEGKIYIKSTSKFNDENIYSCNCFRLFRKKSGFIWEWKTLMQTTFDQELPPDIIFDSLGVQSNLEKQEIIKKYYFSLKKPIKPFPQNTKKLVVKTGEAKTLPCYKYPDKQYYSKRYYTLLVMGETDSGKTTLLDAFINYLAGKNNDDSWRYKLVDENDIKDLPPGESQTNMITSYYVNYQRDDGKEINIKIIATTGLGDTKGVQQDNLIIKQFDEFFKTTLELDYILVTAKSSIARLTKTNHYINDRIQEIFGKDAKDRFMLMCTFSDGLKIFVIEAIEGKLPNENYFCFNK